MYIATQLLLVTVSMGNLFTFFYFSIYLHFGDTKWVSCRQYVVRSYCLITSSVSDFWLINLIHLHFKISLTSEDLLYPFAIFILYSFCPSCSSLLPLLYLFFFPRESFWVPYIFLMCIFFRFFMVTIGIMFNICIC